MTVAFSQSEFQVTGIMTVVTHPVINRKAQQICTNPSCTCADFKKYARKAFWKNILFILVVVFDLSQEILKANIQQFQLHYKESRRAKCHGRGCSNIFTAGLLRLKVERALTVPPNRDEALEQRFYFYPRKQFLANPPHLSNVKDTHFFENGSIPDSILTDTSNALGIPEVWLYCRVLLISSLIFFY